jgi:hypothetical protein
MCPSDDDEGEPAMLGNQPVNVVVQHQSVLIRELLATHLAAEPGITVGGAVTTGPELIQLCHRRPPQRRLPPPPFRRQRGSHRRRCPGPHRRHRRHFPAASTPTPTNRDVPEATAILSLPASGVGSIPVPLSHTGPGQFVAQQITIPSPGLWRLAITVRGTDFDESTVQTDIQVR